MRKFIALAPAAALAFLAACDAPAPTTAGEPVGAADPAPVADGGSVPMPTGLNSEEQFIWSTLTPQAQAQAAEFIANGGTLTQFINA